MAAVAEDAVASQVAQIVVRGARRSQHDGEHWEPDLENSLPLEVDAGSAAQKVLCRESCAVRARSKAILA